MTLFNKIDEMNISDKSKNIYKTQLKKLNDDIEPTDSKYLYDFDKMKDKIKDFSIGSQLNYIRTIMTIIDPETISYLKFYKLKSELNKKNLIEKNQNQKKRNYKNNIEDIKVKLVHDLLKHIPRRTSDLYNLKYYDGKTMDNNYNYLAKNNDKYIIIFNKYKTSDKYGQQIFELPKEIIPTLLEYLETEEANKSDFVFGEDYKDVNGFSQWFKRATGLNFNDMRHLYAQKHLSKHTEDIDEHLKKLAHSYNTTKYYIKT